MKEYKVLTQKDRWFKGNFDPEKLEEALNDFAQHGWRVVAASTSEMPGGFVGTRQEVLVILERDC
jgi:hypothetical protein